MPRNDTTGKRVSRGGSALDIMESPLRIPPMKKDVTPGYNVPAPMSPRDPLGNFPKDTLNGGGKRGR
jgi:hypothetical protein